MISVLYVDDEPALLELGKEFLENSGSILVDTVNSTEDALERLEVNPYDAIVSDYQMPGMDGIGFLKIIRSDYGNLPFILFTGRGREEIVIEALNNGADYYLQKGGNPLPQFIELEHKIKLAVRHRSDRRKVAESERRYRALFENANDAIFLMDRQVYLDCNRKALELFGCSRDQLIGTPVELHSPEFQPDGVLSSEKSGLLVHQARAGMPGIFPWRHKRSNGMEFDTEVSLTRLEVEGRNHLLAIVRDVSERNRTEVALRESAMLMTRIIDFLPDATFAINNEGRVIAWNRSMEKLTGVPAMEIIGRGDYEYSVPLYGMRRPVLIDLISSRDPEITELYDTIRTEGNQMLSEGFFPSLNHGRGAYLWFKASPLLDSRGSVIGAIESIRDITLNKQRETDLRASYEQVAAMEEELRNNFEDLASREQDLARSEARFRGLYTTMVEGSMLGEVVLDTSGTPDDYRILEVNPAFERIFSISRDKAIGCLSRDTFGVMDAASLRCYAGVALGGTPQRFEIWYPPMQKYFDISVYSPARGQFATVFEDVTQRRQKEEDLRQAYEKITVIEEELRSSFEDLSAREQSLQASEEQYRRIVETANEGVWVLDTGYKTVFVNRNAADMLGYLPVEMDGQSMADFMPEDELPDHLHRVENRQKGIMERYERRLIRKDGSSIWCIISATPLPLSSDGGFSGSFAMLTDITAQKNAEQELVKKAAALGTANEEMAVVLEELRSAEDSLLARNRDLEEQRAALATSSSVLSRANQKLNLLSSITRHDVINQLMALHSYVELSNISQDRKADYQIKQLSAIQRIRQHILFTREYQEIGIKDPCWQDVAATVKTATGDLDLSGLSLELDLPDVEVYADGLFPKVFYNILDNAVRYSGNATRIRVSCKDTSGNLVILIEDDGVGIVQEDKSRIFKKGFGKNTGFGLYLSSEILQMTGLSITETGNAGSGARFEIHVPENSFRYSAR